MSATLPHPRLIYLDAARAFALILGVFFHTGLSFLPFYIGWAVQDISTSWLVGILTLVLHSFRLELFFLLAGLLTAQAVQRDGVAAVARSRSVRLLVPFFAGWFLLRPLLLSGWTMGAASLRGDFSFTAGLSAGFATLRTLPDGIFVGTHLWFLYALALVTSVFLLAAAVSTRWPSLARALLTRPLHRSLMIGLSAVALWFMSSWGMDTPDRSLVPHFPTLAVFGLFFGAGWQLARQPEELARWTQLRWGTLLLALGGVTGAILLSPFQVHPQHPHFLWARIGFVLSYATMMWSLVCVTLGAWKKIADRWPASAGSEVRQSLWPRSVRYVADASYWIYLAHLPIVLWLQVALAEVVLPWWVKLTAITVITLVSLLVLYDLLVRNTWVGQILNGRRKPRALFFTVAPATDVGLTPAASPLTTTLASARHDTHRQHS